MLNFNRGNGDRPPDPLDVRNAGKPALRPAIYEPPAPPAAPARALPPDPGSLRDTSAATPRTEAAPAERQPPTTPAATPIATPAAAPAPAGSQLFVGVNIKLKGVEISDCDLLVIEGHVEATVHSKEMHIAKPGTLNGTALIDVAEVHGEFTGELTAKTRLVVHATGKVSGTIRYGRLIVAEGGMISGDMKQIDAAETRPATSRPAAHDTRHASASSRNAGAS